LNKIATGASKASDDYGPFYVDLGSVRSSVRASPTTSLLTSPSQILAIQSKKELQQTSQPDGQAIRLAKLARWLARFG
jgi:hypothetical protein